MWDCVKCRGEVRLEVPHAFQLRSAKGWAISMFSCVASRRGGGMYADEPQGLKLEVADFTEHAWGWGWDLHWATTCWSDGGAFLSIDGRRWWEVAVEARSRSAQSADMAWRDSEVDPQHGMERVDLAEEQCVAVGRTRERIARVW